MKNTFKIGDKITINSELDFMAQMCTRDTTTGKAYEVLFVGLDSPEGAKTPKDIVFKDDVGDLVTLHYPDVTLVKE